MLNAHLITDRTIGLGHRIIGGCEAVLGLEAMKEALEDPARLLFDI
jgi:pyruvate/2-oxoglutarate dehydrogenase complex dihydrolipoamide acyltransferase (E2) component